MVAPMVAPMAASFRDCKAPLPLALAVEETEGTAPLISDGSSMNVASRVAEGDLRERSSPLGPDQRVSGVRGDCEGPS